MLNYRCRKYQQLVRNSLVNLQHQQPLGEILLEAGLISIRQIKTALAEQKRCDLKIGEILAAPDWIKQETADFFAEKWPRIIEKPVIMDKMLFLVQIYRQVSAIAI